MALATFAGGCFWCLDAVFSQLVGVFRVNSGYCGGYNTNPTYEEVCSGATGHAEAFRIDYDSERISYRQLLQVFFAIHDPTTLNRQGADVGTQYRSAIFYANAAQRALAERYIRQIDAAGLFDDRVATTLEPLVQFYVAEDYHHDYAALNPDQPYIRAVATPKVEKMRKVYGGQEHS